MSISDSFEENSQYYYNNGLNAVNDIDDDNELIAAENQVVLKEALNISAEGQEQSRLLRDELENYIRDLNNKTSEDGKRPLVVYPPNFDTIVEAMNRNDLLSTDNDGKSWSKYLLSDSFESQLNLEFGNRYKQFLTGNDEMKIERGLAQINLLDRQLQTIMKIEKETNLLLKENNGDQSSRSDKNNDRTFITKVGESGSTTPLSHRTPLVSHREGINNNKTKSDNKIINENNDDKITEKISAKEELRIKELLENLDENDENDEFFAQKMKNEIIPNDDILQREKEIMDELSKYGHIDRLEPIDDNTKIKNNKEYFLAQE
eukprot:gene10390-13956_t